MADNVVADAGSGGATFAADDIGGIHYPRNKLIHGADGTNDGDVSTANPYPVELTDNNQTAVADIGSIKTATELIDDTVFVDDTATHTAATTKTLGVGAVATPTDTSIDANDIGMLAMSVDRRLHTDTQIVGQDAALDVSAAIVNIADGGGAITVDWAGTAPPIGAGTEAAALRVTVATDSTGVLSVDDNGGALTVDNGGTFAVQPTAVATGGASFFKSIDLDESEEEIKATAATFYGGVAMNLSASVRYLKFYNATAASVTVGTTVPDLTIPIPTQGDTNGAGFVIPIPACGIQFGTALTVAATTGVADADSGAPGANEVVVALFYE